MESRRIHAAILKTKKKIKDGEAAIMGVKGDNVLLAGVSEGTESHLH